MSRQIRLLLVMVVLAGTVIPIHPQTPDGELKTGTLLKRTTSNGVDNYPYATYSF